MKKYGKFEDDDDFECERDDFFCEEGMILFDKWVPEDSYLSVDKNEFVTKSGERYVIRCKYGRDD